MHHIPKELEDRITIKATGQDPIGRITKITPLEPCECGKVLTDTRITRINRCTSYRVHMREWCQTCGLVSILGENDWKTARDLNREMRSEKTTQDK